jgi:hypothetical protein
MCETGRDESGAERAELDCVCELHLLSPGVNFICFSPSLLLMAGWRIVKTRRRAQDEAPHSQCWLFDAEPMRT